jgi:hypothetical protein
MSLRAVPRAIASSAVLLAASAWSDVAIAQPWFEGRAGLGVVAGHFEFEKEYLSAKTGEPAIAHDEGGPFGVAVALGLVGGYAVGEEVALGLTGRLELAPYVRDVNPRYASVDAHLLAAIGSTLAYRPAPEFELRVSPEWAFADFIGSVQEIGADDNVFEHEAASGPGLGVSVGYASAPGWGFAMAGNVVFVAGAHTELTLLTLTLLASWSSW